MAGESQEVRQVQVASEPPGPHGAAPAFGKLRQLGGDGQERSMAVAKNMLLLRSDALLDICGDRPAVPFVRGCVDFAAQLLFHLAVAV